MTYIRIESVHTDDERWLVAGADAFAVHIAALVYCDRQLTDGRITANMARRVSLAVPDRRAMSAVSKLVAGGFWTVVDDGYQIEKYQQHAFLAKQINETRGRWTADKDRRRQHEHGDHSLCKDPKFCPAIRTRSTGGSIVESGTDAGGGSTGGRSHLNPTQPNPTQPEGRVGEGEGEDGFASGGGLASPATPSAAPSPEPAAWPAGTHPLAGLGSLPQGVIPTVNGRPVQ